MAPEAGGRLARAAALLEGVRDGAASTNAECPWTACALGGPEQPSFAGVFAKSDMLRSQLRGLCNAGMPSDDPVVLRLGEAAARVEDQEALNCTVCYGTLFTGGAEANRAFVKRLEADFAQQLLEAARALRDNPSHSISTRSCSDKGCNGGGAAEVNDALNHHEVILTSLSETEASAVLDQNRNLGVALDLVAAYLKNYMIDAADLVMTRLMPLCRRRGGFWLIKGLNALSSIRCKQDRFAESHEMLQEIDGLATAALGQDPVFFDILYRNIGVCLLHRQCFEEALEYFERAAAIKRASGLRPSWMDQWDIGKTLAYLAEREGDAEGMRSALALIRETAELHSLAEPEDRVMHAKVLDSIGKALFSLGEMLSPEEMFAAQDEGLEFLRRSLELFREVCGRLHPLSGMEAQHLGMALLRTGCCEEAKPLLLQALVVEAHRDVIALRSFAALVDLLVRAHSETNDLGGLAECQAALSTGLEKLRSCSIRFEDRYGYVLLLHSVANLLLLNSAVSVPCALDLLEEGVHLLQDGGREEPRFPGWFVADRTAEDTKRIHGGAAAQSPHEDKTALLVLLQQDVVFLRQKQRNSCIGDCSWQPDVEAYAVSRSARTCSKGNGKRSLIRERPSASEVTAIKYPQATGWEAVD